MNWTTTETILNDTLWMGQHLGLSEENAALMAIQTASTMMEALEPWEEPTAAKLLQWCDDTCQRVFGEDLETVSSRMPTN
jgi:hypothetical protein